MAPAVTADRAALEEGNCATVWPTVRESVTVIHRRVVTSVEHAQHVKEEDNQ
jgi:hypothetical protein